MQRLALALIAGVLLSPAVAGASTVTSKSFLCGRGGEQCRDLTFAAAPGERNDVAITRVDGALEVRDTGTSLTAAGLCHAVDANTATCPADAADLMVATGDGDDRVTSDEGRLSVDLGSGDDMAEMGPDAQSVATLTGGPGDDTLTAFGGSAVLNGGPGADTLTGGPGDDTLVAGDADPDGSGAPAADVMDGGGGTNTVSYAGDPWPVTVDLQRTNGQGSPGENDRIAHIANVIGGSGDDDLSGDARANILFGGGGDDHLTGRDGSDRLIGGSGFDHFSGGAGDDHLDASSTGLSSAYVIGGPDADGRPDARPEPIDCGAGRDRIDALDGDLVEADCEAAALPIVFPTVSADRQHERFRLPCPRFVAYRGHCHGTVRIRRLGSFPDTTATRFTIPRGGGSVRTKLSLEAVSSQPTVFLGIRIAFRRARDGRSIVARYAIGIPPDCRAPTRCGATTATP